MTHMYTILYLERHFNILYILNIVIIKMVPMYHTRNYLTFCLQNRLRVCTLTGMVLDTVNLLVAHGSHCYVLVLY